MLASDTKSYFISDTVVGGPVGDYIVSEDFCWLTQIRHWYLYLWYGRICFLLKFLYNYQSKSTDWVLLKLFPQSDLTVSAVHLLACFDRFHNMKDILHPDCQFVMSCLSVTIYWFGTNTHLFGRFLTCITCFPQHTHDLSLRLSSEILKPQNSVI